MKHIFRLSIVLLLMSGCVAKKKYDDMTQKKLGLEVDKAEAEEELKAAQAENERLTNLLDECEAAKNSLQDDTAQMATLYDELMQDYRDLSDVSEEDAEKLSKQIARVNQLMDEVEKKNQQLQVEKKQADRLKQDLKEREKRVQELESAMARKDSAVKAMRDKVSKALLGFKEGELTVKMKNGRVYVSLSEELLFQSGSYRVDKKGVDAIKKLSKVLKEQSEFEVMVEGHTDDVPLRSTATLRDNWDLSVLRATSIARIMQDNGVNPQKLIPAGRGEYHPKVDKKTTEARRQNRRTEIIITPNLEKLFQLLEVE